jgi:hypothetical protein
VSEFERTGVYRCLRANPDLKDGQIFVERADSTVSIMRIMFYFMMLFIVSMVVALCYAHFLWQPTPQIEVFVLMYGLIVVASIFACLYFAVPRRPMIVSQIAHERYISSGSAKIRFQECSPIIIVSEPKVRLIPKWSPIHRTTTQHAVWLRVQLKRRTQTRYALIELFENASDAEKHAAEWSVRLDCPVDIDDAFSDVPTHVVRVG